MADSYKNGHGSANTSSGGLSKFTYFYILHSMHSKLWKKVGQFYTYKMALKKPFY